MRVLSWGLLMLGLTAFTMGCTGDKPAPVETDGTTEESHEGHDHADGEAHDHDAHMDEGATDTVPAPVEEPAPEAEATPDAPAEPAIDEVELDPSVGS